MGHTRRTFLQGMVGAAAAWAVPAIQSQRLSAFGYGAVELLDGPLKIQFDQNHRFFLKLDEDRMLKIFRQRTGLDAPGEDMGGWYDDFCPGATFGQYVSALARFSAITGDAPTRAKVSRLVNGYAGTLHGSREFFADLRFPSYTYDKLVCGLSDAHALINDPDALKVLYATTATATRHMPERALTREEQRARPHKDETYTWDESYTLPENLFLAYERTNDRMFFDMGKRYLLDRAYFDPLAEGRNVLPGLHAYSHMNALSSGMQAYLKLGDEKYFRAVSNAVEMIWKEQSFATGGWGPNEAFVEPAKGLLGESLSNTRSSFETPCGAYAHFKAMRYLLTLTRDARYGDSMEKVLYNTVLGAKPIQEDGTSFYYSDYHHSGKKVYKRGHADGKYSWDRDERWPCCSGTLPQIAADYTISAFFRASDGIYVNLYVPARLRWNQGGAQCVLKQETAYPNANSIALELTADRAPDFTLYLRIPGWAGRNSSVAVNGRRVSSDLQAGTFFPLKRSWKSGDRVELEIEQPTVLAPVDPQHKDQVAVVRGPQVLFAISETQPAVAASELKTIEKTLGLRPFSAIGDETYQTYLRLT